MRFCKNCGQQIVEGESFCRSCGARVTEESPAASTQATGPQTPPPPPFQPPQAPRSRVGLYLIIAAIVVVVGAGASVGGYFLARDGGTSGAVEPPTTSPTNAVLSTTSSATTSSSTTSSTEPPFVQGEGEIFLEAASTAGPEPFTGETFVPTGPTSTLDIPTSTTEAETTTSTASTGGATTGTTGTGVQVASYSGGTAALYGGSKSKAIADKEGQLRFFEENPEKAAAFCAALNSDPTFRWSGGTQIQPSQLRDYFAELTPLMLTRDTRVTNYGYRNGRPTPRQSVLQAGQMVLVDQYGVPRVRCECGNPLTPPKPVPTTPTYTGPRWPGFDPTTIIVIQQTTVIIETFVLVDIHTGDIFVRPVGTTGGQDESFMPTEWQLDVGMAWDDTRPEHLRSHLINWKAEITAYPDGTLSGFGEGIWHCEGTTWLGSEKSGTFIADANLTINITGTWETTQRGQTLHIEPALGEWTMENVDWNTTGDTAELRDSLDAATPGWLQESFTTLDLDAVVAGPLLASIVAGGYTGSAELTPLFPTVD